MKTYLKVAAVFYCLIFTTGFNPVPHQIRWVINSGCSLKVAGITNVNKFTCTILNYSNPDTLSFCRSANAAPVKVTGSVALDVQNFDCQNAIMTKDLRKTLKSQQFPKLVIKFMNLSKYPDFNGQQEAIKGMVSISLAGSSRQYEVDYKVISENGKSLTLIGSQSVNFSDFNLSPPKKMAGMIKTNNALNVEFNLKLKVI